MEDPVNLQYGQVMRILMTGATGLIGKYLGQELVRRGHQLVIVSRSADLARGLPFPCDIYRWDETYDVPNEAWDGVEGIIHLAGEPIAARKWTGEQKRLLYDSRVRSSNALVQAQQRLHRRLKFYISASGVGFYGDRGDELLDEQSAMGTGFLAHLCQDWEDTALTEAQEISERQIVVRTGMVLARQGGALQKLLPIYKAGLGGRLGSGQQWVSWIHLDDIVALYVHAVENSEISGILNGVSPEPITNRDLTEQLGNILQKPAVLRVPAKGLHVMLGEMSMILLESQRALPHATLASGFVFRWPQLDAALADLCQAAREGEEELWADQWVHRPVPEVFEFFSHEDNMAKLIPPSYDFRISQKSTPQLQRDTLIDSRMHFHGLPIAWQTYIDIWEPNRRFADSQLKGPFKRWYHVHSFSALGDGTLISDHIRYRIPLGPLGRLFGGAMIEKNLKQFLNYRAEKLAELFA